MFVIWLYWPFKHHISVCSLGCLYEGESFLGEKIHLVIPCLSEEAFPQPSVEEFAVTFANGQKRGKHKPNFFWIKTLLQGGLRWKGVSIRSISLTLFYFLLHGLTFSSPNTPLFVQSILMLECSSMLTPHWPYRVGGREGRFVGQRVVKAVLIVLQQHQK